MKATNLEKSILKLPPATCQLPGHTFPNHHHNQLFKERHRCCQRRRGHRVCNVKFMVEMSYCSRRR